jgi:hypothetical protein
MVGRIGVLGTFRTCIRCVSECAVGSVTADVCRVGWWWWWWRRRRRVNCAPGAHRAGPLGCPLALAGTVQYNILDAHDPHRFKVSTDGAGSGWALVQRMWVYPAVEEVGCPHAGLCCASRHRQLRRSWGLVVRVLLRVVQDLSQYVTLNVLDAPSPHRFKVSTDGPGSGWSTVSTFRAFASHMPGTTKFYILQAMDPHRFKVRVYVHVWCVSLCVSLCVGPQCLGLISSLQLQFPRPSLPVRGCSRLTLAPGVRGGAGAWLDVGLVVLGVPGACAWYACVVARVWWCGGGGGATYRHAAIMCHGQESPGLHLGWLAARSRRQARCSTTSWTRTTPIGSRSALMVQAAAGRWCSGCGCSHWSL